MKANLTYMVFLIDRSGSMQNIKKDMEGGLKSFVEEQKKVDGELKLSLYQFDDEFEIVGENTDLSLLDNYELVPRGWTSLLDAMGKSINKTGEIFRNMEEEDRPSKVLFVVITDGEENSSVEYNRDVIKKLVEEQTNKWNWNFIYLGANQDAINVGNNIGISSKSSMSYGANVRGVTNMFMGLSDYSTQARGFTGSLNVLEFSDEIRKKAMS